MRLLLASDLTSNDIGCYSDKLIELIGENRKVLLISNARDHRTPELRKEIVDEDTGLLASCGLDVVELDLRKFFNKSDELRKYIDDFNPGCVFAMGGNVYSLATAMHLSGMDKILLDDLKINKYVFAGYSAGSMVTAKDLMNYHSTYGERAGDRLEETKAIYGETFTEGLGLIGGYIIPHAGSIKFDAISKVAEVKLKELGLKPIVLRDSDFAVVQDGNLEVYRK